MRHRDLRTGHKGYQLTTSFASLCCAVIASAASLSACGGEPSEQVRQAEATNTELFSESEAYERFMGRWSRLLAPLFLEFSDLEDGDAVLDVGSGTGALASAVLSAVEPSQVIGVDPSAAYVNYARSRTSDDRVIFEEGDGQELRFPDDSFDAAISLLVINFIPDPGKALNEMIRVTRPRGVVAAAVWDYDEGMEMLRLFWDEAVALNPSSEARDERNMPFSREGELADLWREHGLVDVQGAPLVISMSFPSFDDFWSPFLEGQGPAGAYVASLSEEERLELEGRLRERLQAQGVGAITLTGRAWAVRGVVAE